MRRGVHPARLGRRAGLAGLIAWSLACAGPPPPPPDTFHRLALPPPTPADEVLLPGVVEVARPGASDVLRVRAMVVADADRPEMLRRSRYHYWVDPTPVLVRDALVDYLRRGGLAGRVVTPEAREEPRWRIAGRVLRFEQLRDGAASRAQVALELALRAGGERAPRVQGIYEATRPASGGSAREGAMALGEALAAAFDAFAADVRVALAERQP